MKNPRVFSAVAVLAGLAMLPMLSACAATNGYPSFDRPHTDGDASAVAADDDARQYPALPAGTVVATGELSSLDGLTTGEVSVTATATTGRFDVTISDLRSPLLGQEAGIDLSTEPFDEDRYCSDPYMMFAGGNQPLDPAMSRELRFDMGEPSWINPDFLDTLVLIDGEIGQPATGCYYPVIATAPLLWTLPDFRADLVIADSGSTGGARGEVELHGDAPGSYQVASGDVLAEIAARFGVTVADLHYLNPTRFAWESDTAYAEEVLNLDKRTR